MENTKMLILNNKKNDNFKAVLNLKLNSQSSIKFYNLMQSNKRLALGVKQGENVVKVPLNVSGESSEFVLPKSLNLNEKLFCAVVDVSNAFCPEIILSGSLNSDAENVTIESAFIQTKPENSSVLYEEDTTTQINALIDKNLQEDDTTHYYDACANCKYRKAFYEGGKCFNNNYNNQNYPQNKPNNAQNAYFNNLSCNQNSLNNAQNNNNFDTQNSYQMNNTLPQTLANSNAFMPINFNQLEQQNLKNNSSNISQNFSNYNPSFNNNFNNNVNNKFNQNYVQNSNVTNSNLNQNYGVNQQKEINKYNDNNLTNNNINSSNQIFTQSNNENNELNNNFNNTENLANNYQNNKENSNENKNSFLIKNDGLETFYQQIKSQLDNLFNKYPEEEILKQIILNSKWVKVNYDNGANYYVLGLIYGENTKLTDEENNAESLPTNLKVDYIAYGIPSNDSINAPEDIKDYAQWLPVENMLDNFTGYWIVYQDALNGDTIKVNFV